MRINYNILWLDDDFNDQNSQALKNRINKTVEYLENKGFDVKIIKISNKYEAESELSKIQKIDLFVSDFNINSGEDSYSGFDFLKSTRKNYKQEMLLYSNQSESQIKKYLIEYIEKEDTELSFLGKFIFQSAIDKDELINKIKEIIDLTLIRWEELNALRGLYLAEVSQIEHEAKEYIKKEINNKQSEFLSNISSFRKMMIKKRVSQRAIDMIDSVDVGIKTKNMNMINNFNFAQIQFILCDISEAICPLWEEVKSLRNGFAHVQESIDPSGQAFITLLDKKTKIFEGMIDTYRIILMKFRVSYYSKIPSICINTGTSSINIISNLANKNNSIV